MILSAVLAVSENYGIGYENRLPWAHLKKDMEWFKTNTKGKPILMGSATWASLPKKPLPYRTNIVWSRNTQEGADFTIGGEAVNVYAGLMAQFPNQEVCVIGGAKVYEAMWPFINRLYLTRVPQVVQADTYFRVDDKMATDSTDYTGWRLTSRVQEHDPDPLTFEIWDK